MVIKYLKFSSYLLFCWLLVHIRIYFSELDRHGCSFAANTGQPSKEFQLSVSPGVWALNLMIGFASEAKESV